MYFSVLGPVRVWLDDGEVQVGPRQQRLLLALLLAHAGEPVSLGAAVDLLWGQEPPTSAVNIVHRHIGTLRRILEPGLAERQAGRVLLREAGTYRMDVDAGSLDLLRFRETLGDARAADRDGDPARAVRAFAEALALWRAPAAAGLPAEAQGHPVFAALDRERLAAVKEFADVALRASTVTPALTELQGLAELYPLDEPLQARLILALWSTGHQAEALDAYRRSRSRLAAQLGVDPGVELAAAGERVLSGEPLPVPSAAQPSAAQPSAPQPSAAQPSAAQPSAARISAAPTSPVPAQLPNDLPAFSGRENELARLLALLSGAAERPGTVLISAIGGMAGIGKTTLAVHLAHRVAARFPDGQLYVNLRGFDPSGPALDPAVALHGFLEALGVVAVPAGLEAQAALFRSMLAGRRMLILLDNARDADQVRPLLPGSAGCLVLVTSRNQLSALVATEGAAPLTLDLVSHAEAREFLTHRLGADRVAREPRAVDEIAARCGRLPLALAVIAARAAMNPSFTLTAVAQELGTTADRLDALRVPGTGTDLRAVFSWSYAALGPDAGRLFRVLAGHPGPDISLAATASLAGIPVRRARVLIAELTHACLVTEHLPGRFVLHDLLRLYAAELAEDIDQPGEREAARRRVQDHYLHTAADAAARYSRTIVPVELPPAEPGVTVEPIADRPRALAWFHDEHLVLREILRQSAATGQHRHTWQLVWSLEFFFDRLGHWAEAEVFARMAVTAAAALHDPVAGAHAHYSLGRAFNLLRNDDGARTQLQHALDLFERTGNRYGQSDVRLYLGWVAERLGAYEEGLHHSRRALDLYQDMGHRLGEAMAFNAIGNLLSEMGDPAAALPYCRQALRLFQELEDRHGEAAALDSLGYTLHRQGDYSEAITHYTAGLDLFREAGARHFEAVVLDHLGDSWQHLGEPGTARKAWRDAVIIYTGFDRPAAARIQAKLDETPRALPAGPLIGKLR
ncbi:AfsR/SARP family transcriptional regulator [Actinoplanes sp. NPDC051494]|uniref:AfsR/SARP family transcriptional regulator n=1 Tax=Actinoplanes sp. NPDC051494 TaxID=3363907 RepID=UPI0037A6FF3E